VDKNKMKFFKRDVKGFTLFEMLLVLGIMSVIILMISNYTSQKVDEFRREKAAVQMQQILNAGLAYYMNVGYWPTQTSGTSTCTSSALNQTGSNANPLQSGGYLPNPVNSPWAGAVYSVNCNGTASTSASVFQVSLVVPGKQATANANVVAGMIPMGTAASTTVTGQVLVPGQNLNNARSVNFAGYYHNGACVPAPVCPTNMTADILVVPISLYGVNEASTTYAYYSLYGFTAYAYGLANGTTTPSSVPGAPDSIADCVNPQTKTPCASTGAYPTAPTNITTPTAYTYWRVCLSVTTERGLVSSTADTGWGQYATVMAITRCVPANEYSGSDFTVWTQ
jgi:prepilin-type N-terminal cleavage/methylation domain-containing protein